MQRFKVTRKVDELGRIVLPADMRYHMGIEAGNELEIEYRDGEIIVRVPEASCKLCGSTKNLVTVGRHAICRNCIEKMEAAAQNTDTP